MKECGKEPKVTEKVKDFLTSKVAEGGTSASVAIIKDGEVISACIVGTQCDGTQKTTSTESLFNVGSVSKVYCAMAIMKLVELGKVKLDEPISTYLPRFIMKDERYKKITVRMCINHSSGLPGTNYKNIFTSEWLGDSYYDLMYDYFSKCKLKTEPGTFSAYCNDGFTLAEMIVAKVSGLCYTEFVQKYITMPIGAVTTCTAERGNIDGLVVEHNKLKEYVTALGSGGIATSLIDCARFGYMFIDPKGVFKQESLDECVQPQKRSFLPDNVALNLGLGWDSVRYNSPDFNFGNAYLKSGGTLSFLSYLMVIKEHGLAAAISVTTDCKVDALIALDEICGIALEELGVRLRREKKDEKTDTDTKSFAFPAALAEKYSGIYYNGTTVYRVNISNDTLSVHKKNGDEWADVFPSAVYDGELFISNADKVLFQEHGKCIYLSQKTPLGLRTLGQKFFDFPSVHKAWQERAGKKYILLGSSPYDNVAAVIHGVDIHVPSEKEPILFRYNAFDGTSSYISALSCADDDCEMYADAPGSPGARDSFAPFVWTCDSIEYLYLAGNTLVDTASLSELQTGTLQIKLDTQGRNYCIATGKTIEFSKHPKVRMLLTDRCFKAYYDSFLNSEVPETKEGYVMFMSAENTDVTISIK